MTRTTATLSGCCLLAATLVAVSAAFQKLPDSDDYFVYAKKHSSAFFDGGPAPDSFRPPFYPILLSPIFRFAATPFIWIVLLHIGLTVLTLIGVWRIASRNSASTFNAPLASLLVAVDPILVFQSGQIMTETLFTTLVIWTLLPWLDERPKSNSSAAINGLLAGIGFLTRPTMAPIFLAIGVGLVVGRRWKDLRAWLIASLIFLAIIMGWTLRGWFQKRELIFGTTHGGYTLWLANNPSYYETEIVSGRNWAGSADFDQWQRENAAQADGRDETSKDSFYRQMATQWMKSNPDAALQTAAYRLSSFWGLRPRTGPEPLRPLIAVYFGAMFLLAIYGWILTRSWTNPWFVATLAVIALTAVHTIYWSNMRFRAPIEPLLAIWAAKSLESLWHWRRPAP